MGPPGQLADQMSPLADSWLSSNDEEDCLTACLSNAWHDLSIDDTEAAELKKPLQSTLPGLIAPPDPPRPPPPPVRDLLQPTSRVVRGASMIATSSLFEGMNKPAQPSQPSQREGETGGGFQLQESRASQLSLIGGDKAVTKMQGGDQGPSHSPLAQARRRPRFDLISITSSSSSSSLSTPDSSTSYSSSSSSESSRISDESRRRFPSPPPGTFKKQHRRRVSAELSSTNSTATSWSGGLHFIRGALQRQVSSPQPYSRSAEYGHSNASAGYDREAFARTVNSGRGFGNTYTAVKRTHLEDRGTQTDKAEMSISKLAIASSNTSLHAGSPKFTWEHSNGDILSASISLNNEGSTYVQSPPRRRYSHIARPQAVHNITGVNAFKRLQIPLAHAATNSSAPTLTHYTSHHRDTGGTTTLARRTSRVKRRSLTKVALSQQPAHRIPPLRERSATRMRLSPVTEESDPKLGWSRMAVAARRRSSVGAGLLATPAARRRRSFFHPQRTGPNRGRTNTGKEPTGHVVHNQPCSHHRPHDTKPMFRPPDLTRARKNTKVICQSPKTGAKPPARKNMVIGSNTDANGEEW